MGKKKFVIGAVIVAVAIGVLAWSAFGEGATYYLTTGELAAQGETAYDQNVRVAGNVVPGSTSPEESTRTLRFDIQDEAGTLPIVYQGTVPDAFQGPPAVR